MLTDYLGAHSEIAVTAAAASGTGCTATTLTTSLPRLSAVAVPGLRLVCEAPGAPADAGMAGLVVSSTTGLPLGGAVVRIRAGPDRAGGTEAVAATASAADGSFAFAGLPAGQFTVEATKPFYVTLFAAVSVPSSRCGPKTGHNSLRSCAPP